MASERAQARAVLLRAMSGDLSVEEFHHSWPDSSDPLIRAIFEETEDTVEHVPGSWVRRGTDYERFRKSAPYKTLIVNAQVLVDDFAEISSGRLVEIRGQLLKEVDLDQDDDVLATSARKFVAREVAPGST